MVQKREIRNSTADLAYLLFDLADIDFNYNDKQKSCINEHYRRHEVRFLK